MPILRVQALNVGMEAIALAAAAGERVRIMVAWQNGFDRD
jgi:hypothetical protein